MDMHADQDALLFQLKMHGASHANDIAARLTISPQAVRERLNRLHADGLVDYHDETGGVGRPKRLWRLTEAAWARFPDTHADLSVSLIEAIRQTLGEVALDTLIAHREAETERRYRAELEACETLADKVATLARLRDVEGYMAEWRPAPDGDGFMLIENHCPICIAARACQGFCRAELEVFQGALGPDCTVERTEHLLAGARRCAYLIKPRG